MDQPARIPADPVQRLLERINYERQPWPPAGELKLDLLRELLRRMGQPQLATPVVHIAGTKGKGTTTHLVAAILRAAGLRTGTYTSPHIEHFRERIAIDGEPVGEDLLHRHLQQLWPLVEQLDEEAMAAGRRRLTFLDLASAAAFSVFADVRPDAVVLETGLGGRLDSTNVCQPALSVITSISLDHCRQLGHDVVSIAREKAGIIKPAVPVICGVPPDSPEGQEIASIAAGRRSPAWWAGKDFGVRNLRLEPVRTVFDAWVRLPGISVDWPDLELPLLGAHAAHNASLAIAAAGFLATTGFPVGEPDVRRGCAGLRLPGRIEIVRHHPLVILDIAHNPASAAALAGTLRNQLEEWQAARSRTMIVAISRDKDQAGILRELVPLADRIIVTRFIDNPRATDPEVLAGMAGEEVRRLREEGGAAPSLLTMPDPWQAWEMVRREAGPEDAVCVTGSLFLVAELRDRVLRSSADVPAAPHPARAGS